jgi:hypothetical protein
MGILQSLSDSAAEWNNPVRPNEPCGRDYQQQSEIRRDAD